MMRSILLALLPALSLSFCPQPTSHATLSLGMAPRYDKTTNKWTPASADEGPEAGYDLWGSLLRQGPNPFIQRVFNAADYEQAVLKFMAGDKVDRNVAQSEMDAYLQNPNDWAYNRLNGYKIDYLKIEQKQVALTVVWSVLILSVGARALYSLQAGENFWAIFGMTSKAAWCEADNSCLLDML